MAIPSSTGYLDNGLEKIIPFDTGTQWSDYSTWDSYTSWIATYTDPLVYVMDPIDLGRDGYFNLTINTQAEGEVSYKIYTSTTGAFTGEETETVIAANATNIAAFSGRYVIVAVLVTSTGSMPTLDNVVVKPNTSTYSVSRSGIDTSTLGGSVSAREIDFSRNASHVWAVDIKADSTSYNQDVYVTDYEAATTLIPTVVSKSTTGITFKLVGLDNVARDSTISYEMVLLAGMNMVNGNLVVR